MFNTPYDQIVSELLEDIRSAPENIDVEEFLNSIMTKRTGKICRVIGCTTKRHFNGADQFQLFQCPFFIDTPKGVNDRGRLIMCKFSQIIKERSISNLYLALVETAAILEES